jgi:glucose-6-phosphate isomerase
MFKKNSFFKNYFINSSKYNKNLKKTKKFFSSFLVDLKNNQIPLLESYEKNYKFNFSKITIKKFAKYKNIVVFGMGGSILGTKSIYSFLKKKIKKKVFFFDNLDSNLILKYKKIKNLKNSCFIVVSKSGNTIETISNLGTIYSKNLLKNKLIIITEITDNALMTIANKYNAEIIEHKEFIGGRYSLLSETGMFPAALMDLNLMKFKNLKRLTKNRNFVSSLIKNVAGIYTLNSKRINNSVIINYDSDLNDLGYWYQQLIAESLGKQGKGINPILSFGPKDHHSLLQLYLDGPKDKFFTFLNSSEKENGFKVARDVIPNNMKFLKNKNLKFIINAQCNAVKNVFKLKKIPFREITFNKKNENELGEIATFFVLETILLSRLMNINPFDQPAVEEVKIETKKFLR